MLLRQLPDGQGGDNLKLITSRVTLNDAILRRPDRIFDVLTKATAAIVVGARPLLSYSTIFAQDPHPGRYGGGLFRLTALQCPLGSHVVSTTSSYLGAQAPTRGGGIISRTFLLVRAAIRQERDARMQKCA